MLVIDSKVVLGAVAKGRSSSKPLNALIRRVAALCFAGGLVLHCVFISTKHNPADWPSRGDVHTWPSQLRRRTYRRHKLDPCPGCGVHPHKHPKHLRRELRGQQGSKYNCCIGPDGGYAFDFDAMKWVPYSVWFARHADVIDQGRQRPSTLWKQLAADDSD